MPYVYYFNESARIHSFFILNKSHVYNATNALWFLMEPPWNIVYRFVCLGAC